MSELTDDQLDGLFRKSAEEFDPPFDPAAWQDMKTRLDTHDGNPSGGLLPVWPNLMRWGLPLVLLLLLTGGWFAYTRMTSSKTATKTKEQPVNVMSKKAQPSVTDKSRREAGQLTTIEPTRNAITDSPELPGNIAAKPVAGPEPMDINRQPDEQLNKLNNPLSRAKESEPALTANATNRSEPAYRDKTEGSRSEASRFNASGRVAAKRVSNPRPSGTLEVSSLSAQEQKLSSRRRKKIAVSEMNSLMPMVASVNKQPWPVNHKATQIARSGTAEDVSASVAGQTETVLLPTLTELRVRPARWPVLSSLANRPVVAQPDTVARRVVPKTNPERGLSVRFVVAPDLSTIGLKNFSRPGTNVGLLLEYRLASRWSVQAGVIQSTKVYKASTDDYGFLPDYIEKYKNNLAGIDGRCSMLDIPINLRYDFIAKPQQNRELPVRWFVSGGITSYVMNQENYTYNYYRVYPNSITDIDTSTGGYKLSNLNFSLGYERALSRRLSWQVEPFIKAPLKRVGYFKTNLLSTGVFFSIRYKL
jgi:hypothetical protein